MHSSLTHQPRTPRGSVGVLLALLVGFAVLPGYAMGGDNGIDIPAPGDAQWLQADAEMNLLGSFEKGKTSRRLVCSVDVAGRLRLAPRHVEVHGSVTQRFGSSGQLYRCFAWGKEGPDDAFSEPALAAFWSAAEVEDGVLRLGWLDADEEIEVPVPAAEVDMQRSDDPTPERVVLADGIVLAALEALPGAWAEDETRTVHLRLARNEEEPEGIGRLRIGPVRVDEAGLLVIPLRMEQRGHKRRLGVHTLQGEGSLTLGTDGILRSGEVTVKTTFPDPRAPKRRGADRTTLRLEGQAEPVAENQALAYAELIARSREDPLGQARETLRETGRTAFALLSLLRPDIDRKGWTVQVWEDPPEKDGPWPPFEDTVALIEHVGLSLAAHTEAIGRFVPVPRNVGHLTRTASPAWRVAPKSKSVWIRPADVDSPMEVFLAVVTAAHAKAGHPDLRHVGVRGDSTNWAYTDLDGLLAAALLVEGLRGCHQFATAFGVPSSSGEAAQGLRAKAGMIRSSRPNEDPDHQSVSWTNRALGVIVRSIQEGDDLGGMTRRVWRTSTGSTRDLYANAPDARSPASALWRRSGTAELRGATGATRVGTSILAWLLLRHGHNAAEAESTAVALCDDVLVQGQKGVLWITRWAGEDEAEIWENLQTACFDRVKEMRDRASTVYRRGSYVIAAAGQVPDAWVSALLAE